MPKEHVTATKEKISKLGKEVKMGSVEGALTVYYDALMTYVIKNLNRKLAEITPPNVAFPVAIAGGSATPAGFFELFEKRLREANLRVDLAKIKHVKDPILSVARGCLIAARTQEEKGRQVQKQQTQTTTQTQTKPKKKK
jgi:cell division ATPase FtsA